MKSHWNTEKHQILFFRAQQIRMITTNVSTLKRCAHPCVLFARLSQSETIHLGARPALLCVVKENGRKNDNNINVNCEELKGKLFNKN